MQDVCSFVRSWQRCVAETSCKQLFDWVILLCICSSRRFATYAYLCRNIYRRYCGVSNTCMYVLCSVMVPMLCACLVFILYMCTWDVCTTCRGVHIALFLSVTSLEGTIPLCAVTIWPLHQTALVPCTQSVPIVFRACMHVWRDVSVFPFGRTS